MTRAIILAAGLSSRICAVTAGHPKSLLEIGGKSLLRRQLDQLALHDITDIHVATGYRAEEIAATTGNDATTHYYPRYAATNNLGTLEWCSGLLDGQCLILFADVLVSNRSLRCCIESQGELALLVDRSRVLAGTMRVRMMDDQLVDIGSHIPVDQGDGNFIGIARIGADSIPRFRQCLSRLAADAGFANAYYTEVFRTLAAEGMAIPCVDVAADDWCEIDTPEDYQTALRRAGQWAENAKASRLSSD
jgi:L-glutamine-phosphate cytidylyltransferase